MQDSAPKHILAVIVLAQFAGTSLWFAGNAVVDDLILSLGLANLFIGYITIAVQAGFITGTLLFAILNIADRFSPVKVFLVCALAGAAANISANWLGSAESILSARFLTGFFLAGIYPVGMKIATDWHKDRTWEGAGLPGRSSGDRQRLPISAEAFGNRPPLEVRFYGHIRVGCIWRTAAVSHGTRRPPPHSGQRLQI